VVNGSLLGQILNPDSYADFVDWLETPKTDGRRVARDGVEECLKKIREILKMEHLDYLPKREVGWFMRKAWSNALRGGDKQRAGAFVESDMINAEFFYNRRWQWRGYFTKVKICYS
jgi:ATP-binding cassette, subfamily D (ALD), peroxisomal long-chain fatty acid import protein